MPARFTLFPLAEHCRRVECQMKVIILGSVVSAFALQLAGPISGSWMLALDARPEAIVTGSTLLLLASILRRRLSHRRVKIDSPTASSLRAK
jgi:hypothetical protein